jgi:hypothetical protein
MMNATPTERAEIAAKGMKDFVDTMKLGAERLKRNLVITDTDADCVNFTVDNYPFTLSWGETTRPSIGRAVWIVQYTLCIWNETQGSRWNPPETIDTTLITSQCLNACVRCAFETVAKEEIRQALEDVGYRQVVAEEVM